MNGRRIGGLGPPGTPHTFGIITCSTGQHPHATNTERPRRLTRSSPTEFRRRSTRGAVACSYPMPSLCLYIYIKARASPVQGALLFPAGPAQAAGGPSARVPPSSARAKEPAYGRHSSSPSRQAGGTLLLVIDVQNSGASSRRASKEGERWSALHPWVRTEHR